MPAASNGDASPSRSPTSITSGSEPRRRATKASASADGRSSHWTSSATTRIGASAAASASSVSVARAMRNGSSAAPSTRPNAAPSADVLRLRQRVEPGEDRSEQLVEAGERQVRLGPDAGRPEDSHPRGPGQPDGAFQQRRLADPGVAADQERAAAGRRPGDEAGDDPQLPVPAEDPFASDHRRMFARQATFTTGPPSWPRDHPPAGRPSPARGASASSISRRH